MCCFVCLRMKQNSAYLLVLKIVIGYDRNNFELIFNFLHASMQSDFKAKEHCIVRIVVRLA